MKWVPVTVAAYVVCGFWTYGHEYNRLRAGCEKPLSYTCHSNVYPVGRSIFWPVFWAGVIAIEVTRP